MDQLNTILSNPEYWSPTARQSLEAKFDRRIVRAFLDEIDPERWDPFADRDAAIPLPGESEGYARVLAMGTTGAGKSTLIRQIIGTDPNTERFPSTSAAKTTLCDIEIVMADGPFEAAVSFLARDQVRQCVADCVAAAVAARVENAPEHEVVRRFLEHRDLKFRLNYILGNPPSAGEAPSDAEDDGVEGPVRGPQGAEMGVSPDEREAMEKNLSTYLDDIRGIAEQIQASVASDLEQPVDALKSSDRDAFEELVESELLKDDRFHDLIDRIMEDVESRFDGLSTEDVRRGRDGWPILWCRKIDDRVDFIRALGRFSSNYAPLFGRLLTPMVQGMRVKGPFTPAWRDSGEIPKLVLMDGQGIGHTADSNSSVSTSITARFQKSDIILLVDDAAQPMQAATCAALHSVVSGGHVPKLLMCFTHFDEVRGDNLISSGQTSGVQARKDHVTGSFDNAVQEIGKSLGREAEAALKRMVPDRLLFFSSIQARLEERNKITRSSFERLLTFSAESIRPPEPIEFQPVFDVANLIVAIQIATREFHEWWLGRLGISASAGAAPEHWTRIKALSRRIAHFNADEYDNLRPVADLVRVLQDHISRFLSAPVRWEPFDPGSENDVQAAAALDAIRRRVHADLHGLSTERLIRKHLARWVQAYDHRGAGSTRLRASDIRSVYESGAPVPAEMPGPDANEFMLAVRGIVAEAVRGAGGKVLGWEAESGK